MKPLYYDTPTNMDADRRTFAQIEDDVYPEEINENSYPFFPLKEYFCHVKPDDFILEAGCGPGRILRYLESKNIKTVGIDIIFEALKKVNNKTNVIRPIPVVHCDVRALAFKKNLFKIITLFGTIGYIKEVEVQKNILKELRSHLKKDGFLVVSFTRQYGVYYFMNNLKMINSLRIIFRKPKIEKHFGIWTYGKKDAVALLKECGFRVERLYYTMKKFSLYEFPFLRKTNGTVSKREFRKGDGNLRLNFMGELFFKLLNNRLTESLIGSSFTIVCRPE